MMQLHTYTVFKVYSVVLVTYSNWSAGFASVFVLSATSVYTSWFTAPAVD